VTAKTAASWDGVLRGLTAREIRQQRLTHTAELAKRVALLLDVDNCRDKKAAAAAA